MTVQSFQRRDRFSAPCIWTERSICGFFIFGTTPQENEACETAETEEAAEVPDTCALLEELLLAEMDDISFYRALLFAMTEADLRNAFFEILTDKQNHAVALSHLYAKYFG